MYWLLAPFLAMSLLIAMPTAAQIPTPETWFNPHGPGDFLNMWTKDAPWRESAKKTNVLVLVHWWVANDATEAQLIQIRDFAREHHMQIDLSTEAVAKLPNPTCGNEEGYTFPGENGAAARILLRLGFKVDWVDMDGPINSGSYDTGPQSCQLSIPDLISRVVMTLQDVLALYPDAKIMDVEPIPALTQVPTWRRDVNTFHQGLAQQLGVPVLAMQTDVTWQNPAWQEAMLDLHTYLHEQNQKLSVIYDGSALAQSDADWINSAISNFESVEGELHIIPDEVLFTTWNPNPADNMPETSPTALTWLINRYPRPLSELQVQFVGQGVQGKLTTANGKPIANATINGFKPGVDFSQPLPVQVVQGVVPATAVSAIIGVRVNTECGCNGLNDVLFGAITYQETKGGSSQMAFTFPTTPETINGAILGGEIVGGTRVNRIIAFPGQSLILNSNVFTVTPNARYQFATPAATIGGAGWFGNIDLIWLDSNNLEVNRTVVTPVPGKALISTTVTAADGTFALPHMPRSVDGPNPVTVEFDGGGGAYRSTVWTPLR
jgi:hypothetical protein